LDVAVASIDSARSARYLVTFEKGRALCTNLMAVSLFPSLYCLNKVSYFDFVTT
jgi:hypothetical protein